MEIGTRNAGAGRLVLSPVGDLDMAGVPAFDRALDALLGRPDLLEIVVDLAGVDFLDSTGVAALLRGAAETVGRGATLRVTDPQPLVARVLRITAVDVLLGWPGGRDDDGSAVESGWRRLR
ncbi:anti-sigma factor antagonist [Micromonospora terminaliae]|uniref:Anti-sigma factor antagonist n=1 Tax=Micromonospora terminaliae TaxID=1914461 RepID=A0AAJ3DPW4_9ACTN|nr:STAS domain-containing protein [Micromonospora terminaliae]NES32000.1 STAS domain-containing protein [Micromonospora terminaliae]QGL45625.1 anti-sigma factor antagonist [Micromonospora terminaliae]